MADVFRQALVTPLTRRGVLQPDVVQNTLLRLPVAAATAPFNQDDWPNPVRRVSQVANLFYSAVLLNPQAAPFEPVDAPNPSARRRVAHMDLVDQIPVLTLPVASAPGKPIDWPNPTVPKRVSHYDAADLIPVLTLPIPTPFSLDDWQNPRGAKSGALVGIDFFPPNRIPPPPPLSQDDWPNPRLRIVTRQADSQSSLYLPIQRAPFVQSDWPNPWGARRDYQTGTQPSPPYRFPIPRAPFAQSDWPNPRIDPRLLHQRWMIEGTPIPNIIPPPIPVVPSGILVQDYIGMHIGAAGLVAYTAGFTGVFALKVPSRLAEGIVVDQQYAQGTYAPTGASMLFTISAGHTLSYTYDLFDIPFG